LDVALKARRAENLHAAVQCFMVAGIALWVLLTLNACAPTTSGVLLPPTRFQYPPMFPVPLLVVPADQVHTVCAARGAPFPQGSRIEECYGPFGYIWPDPCEWLKTDPANVLAALACHSQGHANGWPADHSK
jgi:hypothetical protein